MPLLGACRRGFENFESHVEVASTTCCRREIVEGPLGTAGPPPVRFLGEKDERHPQAPRGHAEVVDRLDVADQRLRVDAEQLAHAARQQPPRAWDGGLGREVDRLHGMSFDRKTVVSTASVGRGHVPRYAASAGAGVFQRRCIQSHSSGRSRMRASRRAVVSVVMRRTSRSRSPVRPGKVSLV